MRRFNQQRSMDCVTFQRMLQEWAVGGDTDDVVRRFAPVNSDISTDPVEVHRDLVLA